MPTIEIDGFMKFSEDIILENWRKYDQHEYYRNFFRTNNYIIAVRVRIMYEGNYNVTFYSKLNYLNNIFEFIHGKISINKISILEMMNLIDLILIKMSKLKTFI